MRITVGVTDTAWLDFLRADEDLYEVNFWVPSGIGFTGRAARDEPFLFKTKSPMNQLVGGGFFVHYWKLRVSEAWAAFGPGNGCASEAELAGAIQRYRERNRAAYEPDPTIGCVVLRNPFFADRPLPQPEHWGASIVKGKTYDDTDPDFAYVDHAFRALQGAARVDLAWDRDLVDVDLDPRYGDPVLTRPRLGQASFRLAVLDAYQQRCAVTGSRAVPALEAAHIRSYSSGGRHLTTNGLSLRSDLHRLFDRGYLGVDPADFRLRVSPRLAQDYGNGVDLYERQERGEVIRLPTRADDRPEREALDWHLTHVFRSA